VYNSECLDVQGKATNIGATVDTWSCVSAANEAFKLDLASGQLVDRRSKHCVGTAGCTGSSGLCLVACGDQSGVWSRSSAGDDTIRPKGDSTMCLQTATKVLDANVFVAKCGTPPTAQQQWKPVPPPPPAPPPVPYAGTCVRVDRSGIGVCLNLDRTGKWTFGNQSGTVGYDPTERYTTLKIIATGSNVTAVVNGKPQPSSSPAAGHGPGAGAAAAAGMVSLNSGYNVAYFDKFRLSGACVHGACGARVAAADGV
jgi:hypothetical protein